MNKIAIDLPTPRVFKPLLYPSRYKAAHGGRGSGKSHFFAEAAVEHALMNPGSRGVCIREVQKDLSQSAKLLIEDKIQSMGVSEHFRCLHDRIETPGGGLIVFKGMQDYNADSIKSLEGFDWAWVEEAHTLTSRSLELLRPTIRKPGSELWFSWNPRSVEDPVDNFFRSSVLPPDAVVVQANYSDNPFFPDELESERKHDEAANPERYAHIWLGHYEPMAVGAIWRRQMFNDRYKDCPTLKRIVVAIDPAVSAEDGSNEHGIIVAGLGEDGRGYVLEDGTTKGGPTDWANRACVLFDKWAADAVVAERNQGGDMVKHTLRTVRPHLPVVEVHATRGKHVRAEPIASLYALGRVSHVGMFEKLETQMCQMTAAGYEGNGSPDRVDALVWGLTELFPDLTAHKAKPRAMPQVSRKWVV